MKREQNRLAIDIPTLAAISTIAWVLVNVSHEIIGHAGAAVLLGIPVMAVSTTTAHISWDQVFSVAAMRTIMAAGTVMNLLTGMAALIFLRFGRQVSSAARYFLWLFSTFSFIIAAMNLTSAMLIGAGDWTEFLIELEPRSRWKTIIIGIGVLVTLLGYVLPLRLWMPDLKSYRRAQWSITLIPVGTMMIVQSLSLIGSPFLLPPFGASHLLACVFAYLHFILWAILVNIIPVPRTKTPPQSIQLPRSNAWLWLGIILALVYFFVLGPGIGSAG
ncbi:MAG: hypothetical protein HPY85_08435 [Anaerolineae bacterium]|nr:hypothetical protein [Anaerolineae bacterium]